MATKRSVDIDSEKLRKEFEKRNLSIKEVAETIGVTAGSLSKNLTARQMSNMAVAALQRIFNINMDDIVLKVESEECTPVDENKENSVTNINVQVDFEDFYMKHSEEIGNKLHQIIYSAVYEAVKKAWAE